MELIKVSQNAEGQSVVSARELYAFLGLDKSQWARWYPKNILKNPYAIADEDYIELDIKSSSNNGYPTKDFALSLDFAKRLAMRAQTDRGEQARLYFLDWTCLVELCS